MKPLITIENYGKISQVVVCGMKIGCTLSEVSYTATSPEKGTPHIKVDIDIVNFLHMLANLSPENIEEITRTAHLYLDMYRDTCART